MQIHFDGVRAYALLILLCTALYIPGLTTLPPIDRDEARFVQATRQMIASGDYVRIRFQEEPRNKKPIGIYWFQAAMVKALGASASGHIWPYRIPSFIGATLAVLLTFAFGRRLIGSREAFLGAALLSASLLLIFEAHQATTDAALLAAVVASQGALSSLYLQNPKSKHGLGLAATFWVAQGIGILIKGPIVPLIATLTILTLVLIDRKAAWLKELRPLPGILLVAFMVLPWGIAITKATGGTFFTDAIQNDLLPKLVSGQESHGFKPGYYLLLLPVTFWPASMCIGLTLRDAWERRTCAPERFCIAWILPAWILFELVPTKLPHYIMPTYPALALLTARTVYAIQKDNFQWPRFWPRWGAAAVGSLAGIVALAGIPSLPWFLDGSFDPLTLWPMAAAILTIGSMVWTIRRLKLSSALASAIVGTVLIFAPTFQVILPGINSFWLSRSIAQTISGHTPSPGGLKRTIVAAGYHEPSLVFLMGTETGLVSPEKAAEILHLQPGAIAIVSDKEEQAFLQKAQELELSLHLIQTLKGFHYSKGRMVTLKIYNIKPEPVS